MNTGMPSRRSKNKAEINLRIMQCAMKLFRKQGIENTTMESIAAEANVSKRTLYSYFPAKEAIVSGFWLHNVEQKTELLPLLLKNYPDTRSRLLAVFLDASEGFKREPEFARIHFTYQFQQFGTSKQPHLHNDFGVFLTAIMNEGQQLGDIRQDISAQALAQQIMLIFTAICFMWFPDPKAFSLDERLENAIHCFIDGANNQR